MIRSTQLLFALLALLFTDLPARGADDRSRPSYDSYNLSYWSIACDNGLRCAAKGLRGIYQGSDLLIERDAGPVGAIRVKIAAAFPFAIDELRLDGKPLGLDPRAWRMERRDGVTRLSTDRQAVARAFIERIRNAHDLEFATREDGYIPLRGLSAALLRMDERQGRIGSVTALVRPGARAPGTVPPPPDLPVLRPTRTLSPLSAADETALTSRARKEHADMFLKQCERFLEPIKDQAWKLDDQHILILIPCSVGKYEPDQRLFLGFMNEQGVGGPIKPLSLPYPLSNYDGKSFALPGAEYSPETGTLYLFAKQGVRADCGSAGEWLWTDGAFRLSSFTKQDVCGGSAPQEWLTVYRSRR